MNRGPFDKTWFALSVATIVAGVAIGLFYRTVLGVAIYCVGCGAYLAWVFRPVLTRRRSR